MHFSPDASGASPSEDLVRFVAVDKQDSVCPCFSLRSFFIYIYMSALFALEDSSPSVASLLDSD